MKAALLLFAAALLAQDKAAAPAKLTELQALKLENAAMRLALLQKDYDALVEAQNAIVADICKGAGIEPGECSIDPRAKTVMRKPKPTEPKK